MSNLNIFKILILIFIIFFTILENCINFIKDEDIPANVIWTTMNNPTISMYSNNITNKD